MFSKNNYLCKVLQRLLTLSPLLILLLSQKLYSQTDSYQIEHFTGKQGLPNSNIWSIIQDNEGYLWFTTGNGIVKYDGYQFQSYVNIPGDTTSFVNGPAPNRYVDKNGTIWFSSSHGLEKYNRRTDKFTNYLPDDSAKGQVPENVVFGISEDKRGIFWVTTEVGVFKFNKTSGKFSPLQFDSTNGTYTNYIFPFVDKDGSLWFATNKGLDKFNYETGKIMHYWRDPQIREVYYSSISKYYIECVAEDSTGTLWLGTNKGIVEFNKKSNTFTDFLPDSSVHNSWGVNHVSSLCFDHSGFLWVGTGKGIFTFNTKSKRFVRKFVNKSHLDFYNLGNDFIEALYIDRLGALWVGTWSDGIYRIKLKRLSYKRYFPGGVQNVIKGKDGILWIEKFLKGWTKFDTRTGQVVPTDFTIYQYLSTDQSGNLYYEKNPSTYLSKVEDGKIIARYNLLKIPTRKYYEKDKGIWYGAYGGGVYFLDFKTGLASKIFNTGSRHGTYVIALFRDSRGLVWAATYMGSLFCYNTKNKSVSNYISDPQDPSSISGIQIYNIYEDKKGRLWFATDAGLERFIPSTKTFIHYTGKDGLLGNIVYNILEDEHGNLWLGTNKGISKFNPETTKFKNFDVLYGISTSDWFNHLAVKMDDGEMFFGRSYGLIGFYPDSIKVNTNIPPTVITSCMLFDKQIPFGKEIKLPYDKNFLSFKFAALSYYNSQRNQYAYKMEGVDKDWVYSGTRHYASYPNLAPGKYIFRVKGSNSDGIWNKTGASISIIIWPPWWETSWAYIFYGLIFLFTLYGLRRYELKRVKLKDKIKMDAAILKEREETDKIKSRFFANISHEFRTPLTLIQGPVEKIISDSSNDIKKDAGIIKKNSRRLLQLVSQLLDLSKLESGKLKLEASKNNIVSFVKGIVLSFESLSEEKDITLKILSDKELIEVYFDKEKMIRILSNILSNAFKFTPRNGKITVSIKECHAEPALPAGGLDSSKGVPRTASFINGKIPGQARNDNMKEYVEIKIKDTGIGIPKEEIPKLFDRFYQVDSSFTKEYQGTGIGLALTKELVELHHGTINVGSKKDSPAISGTSWTEFTLYFLLGRNHLKDEEIVEDKKNSKSQELVSDEEYHFPDEIISEIDNETEVGSVKEEKTIILVVEDNYDMREYIRESLAEDYSVEEAINGEQGVRKAENIIPDLIISDTMMPKMDGNEMARRLKNNEKTSHIPIIILTAKSGQDSKLEGLETGADDYLTKPFDIKELQVRIKNLIRLRKKLQEKFGKIEVRSSGKEEKTSHSILDKHTKLRGIDEKFINKIQEIVNDHISEEDFSIEMLGSEVGMSRSQVLRKIKALTGKSPSLYIRSIRLSKAKSMIENREGNISEISYSVGFSSPVYFSKCFKEEFGYSPKHLI